MENLKETLQAIVPDAHVLAIQGVERPMVAVPDNYSLTAIDEALLPKPLQHAATVDFRQYVPFKDYVNAYKQAGGRVFIEHNLALTSGGKLATAILDYAAPGETRWSTHIANLVVQPSLEYSCLRELDGKLLAQDVFAREILKVARFCTSMQQADLIELAQKITLTAKGAFKSITDELSGSVNFMYDVKVDAKLESTVSKELIVPSGFTFDMALLHGGARVSVPCDFLYRIPEEAGGKIQLGLRIVDRLYIERDYLEDVVSTIAKDTSLPTAIGSLTSYQK